MEQAKENRSVQPCSRWNNAIIRAICAENIEIRGEKGSVIDGANCFDECGEEGYRGPHGINIWYCKNIKLSGYTLKNTGNWAHAIQNSCNICAEQITILGGHDGFDVRSCDNIKLFKCEFYTGDDAIAGFDNIDVTIRDCVLNSSCSAMRFGGTNVLVENCVNSSPNSYGYRGTLSDEEKKARAKTTPDNSRFNCLTAFLYYCDFRAKIRKTPGNIIIKNCSFKNIDSVFSLPFGHIWVCNHSLESIIFENCEFDGIVRPININCPENEKIVFTMKNCKISASSEAKDEVFMVAHGFKDIILENVEFSGYDSPQINYSTKGNIIIKNTNSIMLKKTENCTEAGY